MTTEFVEGRDENRQDVSLTVFSNDSNLMKLNNLAEKLKVFKILMDLNCFS